MTVADGTEPIGAGLLHGLVAPGRQLLPAGDGLLSALPPATRTTRYDRRAGLYDRLVPNRAYSRLAWGTDPHDYLAFADEAVGDSDGPLLDVAGGTAVFTDAAYLAASRTVVVTDLSLGMLRRARARLGEASHVVLVQADAADPPFAPGAFATVACMNALHVFADPRSVVRTMCRVAGAGGRLFLSGLVTGRPLSTAYLMALARAGEAGPPRSAGELEALVSEAAPGHVRARQKGSMLYVVVDLGDRP